MNMFTQVKSYKSSPNHQGQPTKEECQQIVNILNNIKNYHQRIALKEEDCGDIKLDYDEDCHPSDRKIADFNKYRGWKRVSGYLFSRQNKDKFNKGEKISIILKHHSVIQDENSNFLETMEIIYPLDKYFFILHDSALKGWDLEAS